MKFLIVLAIFLVAGIYIVKHDGLNVKCAILAAILAVILMYLMNLQGNFAKAVLLCITAFVMIYDMLAFMNPTKQAKDRAKAEYEAAKAAAMAQKAAEEAEAAKLAETIEGEETAEIIEHEENEEVINPERNEIENERKED